ncbi:5-oxoprolinase/urea amidolyase family protein [Aurantimonas sp. Leaf443]|uniref:5-oxoprolinase subunit B/C family protein n=1 Tax=Aurantimonas sp. Leaf443 TaxID=1736378 RepID=UPI0006F9DC54|nr:5-oxoprolinase/urea amidolyase family protein [Aurantimonas sp. Leaf443]KQT85255.1 allophanate hydrolase [Aurantimonas sp. Leaf443]
MRFLPVSLRVLLVELEGLDETLALFASLSADPVAGIDEVLPAARTLMIRFRPEIVTPEKLAEALRGRDLSARIERPGALVEVPTLYDGEDLAEVAALTGLTVAEVIARHTAGEYTVAFSGFAPGFGYLVGGDNALHVPRRRSPRTRIPAGSVALAGPFAGVYPQESPGGWQLIGTTPVPVWDLSRDPPAFFQPGDRVRFVSIDATEAERLRAREADRAALPAPEDAAPGGLAVLAAPMPALFQDRGRFGETRQGVSSSGALDLGAMRAANRLVGNPAETPVLEITGGGFALEARQGAVVALAGAPAALSLADAAGRRLGAEIGRPFSLEPGDRLALGAPGRGMRTYLAWRGGFEVAPVLGSASTDTLAHVGPPSVRAGTVLRQAAGAGVAAGPVALSMEPAFVCPAPGETVTLDVVMGPRTDWFTPAALALFESQAFEVTPQSSRVGMRLQGPEPLERRERGELASEGTATGAIQVPPSGQPVLFLADHPLTGGYPVIACVAEHHLDLAGQIPVGAFIRFRPIRPFAEIAPLARQDQP